MELSLVPIEGQEQISEEEKARAERRSRRIPPEEVSRFDNEDRKLIKNFLTSLITQSERFHHDMREHVVVHDETEAHEIHIAKLHAQRHALFEDAVPVIADFIELLQFFEMEPWPEFEMMIAGIRGEDQQAYYEAKLAAAVDPYRMDMEGDTERAQDEQMENAKKCRITPTEIEELIQFHSLESLVKNLIHGRRLMNGQFWDASHYNV